MTGTTRMLLVGLLVVVVEGPGYHGEDALLPPLTLQYQTQGPVARGAAQPTIIGIKELSLQDKARVAVSLDAAQFSLGEVTESNLSELEGMSPQEQDQVSTSLALVTAVSDYVSYMKPHISNFGSHMQPYATKLQNYLPPKASEILSDLRTFVSKLRVLRFVSAALSTVPLVGAIFNVVAAFSMPHQLDVIKEHFDVVNKKLDGINLRIKSMRKELKSSIEFNAWMTTYIEWELDILNGEVKLTETQNRLIHLNDERQKLIALESFVRHFEITDIEGKARKIHQLTGITSTTTKKNLFDLLVEERGCDVMELSRFMLIIADLMTSAEKQTVIYQFVKYGRVDYARENMAALSHLLHEISQQYVLHVWYCHLNFKNNAIRVAQEVTKKHGGAAKEKLSRIIQGKLSDQMPWYEWAVVLYRQASRVTIRLCSPVTIASSGAREQFFTLRKVGGRDDTNILVIWQDAKDKSHGCGDIEEAHTFVPFQACYSCNADALTASDNMVTGKQCLNHIANLAYGREPTCSHLIFFSKRQSYSEVSKAVKRGSYSFVAAGFSEPQDPCLSSDVCNGHGICHHIPDTSSHLCLCQEYYEGENCQEYHNPASADNIIDMVARLRDGFSSFIGVPTVIDVYVQIRDIPLQLEKMRRRIMHSTKYTQIISQYGHVFSDAKYISLSYNQLQSGNISEKIFSNRVKDINFHRIVSDLKEAILGKGILIQQDFLAIYKKSFIAESGPEVACTERYFKAVSSMINILVTLDQVVTEANLWDIHWRVQQITGPETQELENGAQRIVEAAQRRRDEYAAHWEATSCPKLTADDLEQGYCDARHSYQGLQLSLNCINQKQAFPSSVTCMKSQGRMQWTARPQCIDTWGSWGSWSTCSRICGGGERTRSRRKPEEEMETLTESCNTEDCCQAKFSTSSSVPTKRDCDSDEDCEDGSDEATSQCS